MNKNVFEIAIHVNKTTMYNEKLFSQIRLQNRTIYFYNFCVFFPR